jgi:hypothetical protein
MVDTLIPISGPGSTGGQSQPGLSGPCWVLDPVHGSAKQVPCGTPGAFPGLPFPSGQNLPGGGAVGGAIGGAAKDVVQNIPGMQSIGNLADWLGNGAHWKGLGLLWGAVMLAGVGVVILVFGPSTKQAAGQRVQGFRNAPAQKIRGGGGGGKRSAAASAAKAAAE